MPEFDQNLLDYAVQVRQHFLIPKPYDAVTTLVEQLRATPISIYHLRVIAMLRTVNFDYRVTLATTEIDDEVADLKLAAELKTGQLAPTQTSPQFLFRWRQVAAQRPRQLMGAPTRMYRFWQTTFSSVPFHRVRATPPTPPPGQGEELE